MASEKRTLLLDVSYQPLQATRWEHAMYLVCKGAAEVVAEYDEYIKHPRVKIRRPAVVRVLRMHKRPSKHVKFSKRNVFARDNEQCQYCGDRPGVSALTYDHIVPRAQGGRTTWANIVTCCETCNSRKADRTPAQAGMTLRSLPYQPNWMPMLIKNFTTSDIPEEWGPFIEWAL